MSEKSNNDHIEKVSKIIEKETDKIIEVEKKIDKHEKEIIDLEENILKNIKKNPLKTLVINGITPREANYLRGLAIKKIARHKYVYTLLASLGVVLIWRGLWELTAAMPLLSYPLVALIAGFLILWFINKLKDIY